MWLQDLVANSKLIRNKPLEQRIQYRKDKQKTLQITNQSSTDRVIIVVQYPEELKLQMTCKCIIGNRAWSVQAVLDHMKKYVKDATAILIPKSKTTVTGNKKIGELYDLYHDREDGLLYLMVLSSNPF